MTSQNLYLTAQQIYYILLHEFLKMNIHIDDKKKENNSSTWSHMVSFYVM